MLKVTQLGKWSQDREGAWTSDRPAGTSSLILPGSKAWAFFIALHHLLCTLLAFLDGSPSIHFVPPECMSSPQESVPGSSWWTSLTLLSWQHPKSDSCCAWVDCVSQGASLIRSFWKESHHLGVRSPCAPASFGSSFFLAPPPLSPAFQTKELACIQGSCFSPFFYPMVAAGGTFNSFCPEWNPERKRLEKWTEYQGFAGQLQVASDTRNWKQGSGCAHVFDSNGGFMRVHTYRILKIEHFKYVPLIM